MKRPLLSDMHPKYADRLMFLARATVIAGATPESIKADIEARRRIEDDAVAEDFAECCRVLWREIHERAPRRAVRR